MKNTGKVSPSFGRRAWLALIDEDSECCRAQRRLLTTRYHRYTIGDKSDESQDASLRVEIGNPDLRYFPMELTITMGVIIYYAREESSA